MISCSVIATKTVRQKRIDEITDKSTVLFLSFFRSVVRNFFTTRAELLQIIVLIKNATAKYITENNIKPVPERAITNCVNPSSVGKMFSDIDVKLSVSMYKLGINQIRKIVIVMIQIIILFFWVRVFADEFFII